MKGARPLSQASLARSVILGTAGHIDHGKTALVQALTGTDTDRLPEEKARGITIDLGHAALLLQGPAGERLDVSLIDVPGHHAFVRNMLAGTGGIDAVMLVVAADEGPQAQTVEHLQICSLLGLQHGLVVLSKQDRVGPERLAAAQAEVRDLVRHTFLRSAPVVSVSAHTGEGLAALRGELASLLLRTAVRNADQVVRLPVDRTFSVRGFGTVVTGTLQAGELRPGASMVLEPAGRTVRLRGLQVHGKTVAGATAPNRVALNLAGVEVAEIERGDTLVPAATLPSVHVLDAEVELLPGAEPLRHRQQIRLHAFAAETMATLLLFPDDPTLPAAATPDTTPRQLVRLRFARPMLLLPGDRFVLRRPSPAATLAGGRVLDTAPLPRLRRVATARWLRNLLGASEREQLLLRVGRREQAGISLTALQAETGVTEAALRRRLAPLQAERRLFLTGREDLLLAAPALETAKARVLAELRRAPAGVGRSGLSSGLRLPDPVLALALDHLERQRLVHRSGELLSLERPAANTATPSTDGTTERVERLYREAGLASPLVNEVGQQLRLSTAEVRSAATALLRAGRLLRLGSDALLVHTEAVERLKAELRNRQGQVLDVGAFKQLTGLSRKHAIPLLEYLDGARITRSTGGQRMIN